MQSITAKELQEILVSNENIQLIDVREHIEVATGKIPEAIHIPLGEIPTKMDQLNNSKPLYVICATGGRSASACEFLSINGFKVANVSDGMMNWQGKVC